MNIIFNGRPRQIDRQTTLAQLLQQLDLAPQRVAVEVNLELVPRKQHADTILREGDSLEVVTLVGGG